MHIAGDVHLIGRSSQSQYLSVKTYRDIYFVVSRQKHESVALRAEFIASLRRVNFVDLFLNLRRRHGRVEDEHIRPEVRLCVGGRYQRGGGSTRKQSRHQAKPHSRDEAPNSTMYRLQHFPAFFCKSVVSPFAKSELQLTEGLVGSY